MGSREKLAADLTALLEELSDAVVLKPEQVLVVGCSTSEVAGRKIGTAGSPELAGIIWSVLHNWAGLQNICLAVQCCEHLNRALVVERELLQKLGLTEVAVEPVPHAGGALAAAAFANLGDPAVAESISADLGLDIGLTMIGMHLKRVAVPVRLTRNKVGEALVVVARTRPPYIGGPRAVYKIEGANK